MKRAWPFAARQRDAIATCRNRRVGASAAGTESMHRPSNVGWKSKRTKEIDWRQGEATCEHSVRALPELAHRRPASRCRLTSGALATQDRGGTDVLENTFRPRALVDRRR